MVSFADDTDTDLIVMSAFRTYLSEVARGPQPGSALPPHYLPCAVAFASDRLFVRHLEQVGTPPPIWYDR